MARLIDADAFDEALQNAQTECKKNGGNFRYGVLSNVRANLATMPTVGGWISVKDKMPESGEHVLVSCEIRPIGRPSRKYACEAFYAGKFCISDVSFEDDIAYDYNEEEDEYYLKEGWYECIHNWDEYSSIVIGDFVTAWMPLPEPPKEGEVG